MCLKLLNITIFFSCVIGFCYGQMNISKLCPNDTIEGGLYPDSLNSITKPLFYHYQYNCSLQYYANLKLGFMDTFSLANEKFRYRISPDTAKDCILEKFENDEWKVNIAVDYTRFTDTMMEDINNDGYKDFIVSYQWWKYAYLFNPKKRIFEEETSFELQYYYKLIDTRRNIYCDNVYIHGEICSHLYTFSGLKQQILYTLYFRQAKDADGFKTHVIKAIELYKGEYDESRKDTKPTLIRKTVVNKSDEEYDDFNYVGYWKKRYKALLSLN